VEYVSAEVVARPTRTAHVAANERHAQDHHQQQSTKKKEEAAAEKKKTRRK